MTINETFARDMHDLSTGQLTQLAALLTDTWTVDNNRGKASIVALAKIVEELAHRVDVIEKAAK